MEQDPTQPAYQVGLGDAMLFRSRVIFVLVFLIVFGTIAGSVYAANITGDMQYAEKNFAQGWAKFSKSLAESMSTPEQTAIPTFAPIDSSSTTTSTSDTTTTTNTYQTGTYDNSYTYPTPEPTIDYEAKIRQENQQAQDAFNKQVQQDNQAFEQGKLQNQQQYDAANQQAQQQMDQFKQQSDQKVLQFQQEYGITPFPAQ